MVTGEIQLNRPNDDDDTNDEMDSEPEVTHISNGKAKPHTTDEVEIVGEKKAEEESNGDIPPGELFFFSECE